MKSQGLTARLPRLSLAGIPLALLAVAALLALAALLPDSRAAQAQSVGATPAQAPGLQVSIAASSANPRVNEPVTLTATIANGPSEETPAYNWEIDFGSWVSFGGGSTFRYGNGKAETLRFRLTVSYDGGVSATSAPLSVTWVAPTPEPTPELTEEPTQEPTSAPTASPTSTPTLAPTEVPTPEPAPEPTQEPTSEPTEVPTASPTPAPTPEPTPEPTQEPTGGDSLPAPAELRVAAERGSLDVSLDWNDVDGADTYRVRWRPAGPDSRLNDGMHVQSTDAVITVARYGEWVARVQACDAAGCGAPAAKKFRVRRPRAVPDITPLPTATPTPEQTTTPTPTATSTPEPASTPTPTISTPTPEPTATPTPAPSVPIPAKPAGLSVSAASGSLDVSVDWDDVSGASHYWLRWRESGSGSELNEGVAVLPSEAVIAVSVYGEWVARLQACNDSGCGAPAVSRFTVEPEPTVTPTPESTPTPDPEPTATPAPAALRLAPALDADGRMTRAFNASWDAVAGAASYTLDWWQEQDDSQAQAQSRTADTARQARDASGVSGRSANPQSVNRRSFTGDRTNASIDVPSMGAWNVRLNALDDEGDLLAQSDSRIELKFYGTDNVSVIYRYDCQTTDRNRIEARPVNGGLEIRWHENNEPVTKHQYIVHPYDGPWMHIHLDWTDIPGGDVDSYTIRGLRSGATYTILLRAVKDGRQCLEWVVHGTPIDPTVGALTGLATARVPDKDAAVKLTWDDPNDATVGYDIQYRTYSLTGRWTSITPDSPPAASGGKISATVSGLTTTLDCASYDFRVRARRGSAVGPYAETYGYGATEIRGTDAADTLTGGAGDECIHGLGGDDTLTGGAGDDRLDGGAGADALDGGAGSDTANYSASGAAVTVDLSSSAAQSGGDAQGDTLANIENIIGSAHADTLTGNASDNIFRGGAGADTLNGGAGSDTVDYSGSPVGVQDHRVRVGVIVKLASGDIRGGHAQDDTLSSIENVIGTDYSDLIIGDASDNIIRGGANYDQLFGSSGDDTIYGGEGLDIMYGDDGDDTLYGGGGSDWMHGEAGDDTMYGGTDQDWFMFRVDKGVGTDTIEDYDGDDLIFLCKKHGTPTPTWTSADVGSDYVITVRRSGEIIGSITVKGFTSQSPNFRNFYMSTLSSPTGACWGGGVEYHWK